MKVIALKAILKNTMKMNSLRCTLPLVVYLQAIAILALGASVLDFAGYKLTVAAATQEAVSQPLSEESTKSDKVDSKPVPEKKRPAFFKRDKSANNSAKAADEAGDKTAEQNENSDDKKSKKSDKKAKGDKKSDKEDGKETAEEEELSPEEAAYEAAVAERAKTLRAISTPFNRSTAGSGTDDSLPPPPSDAEHTLGMRLGRSQSRGKCLVYFPGKLAIGKAADFVVKGPPGSQAAIAMADKDIGAKPVGAINLRLGSDRKLMAAGTIPSSGVLTLTVDMPIQGDLIGQPVFFEAVVWQKPDFSDIYLAQIVKSETPTEIADKPNAIIVTEEKAHKRGVRFVPEGAVPQYQLNTGNQSLDSGRP